MAKTTVFGDEARQRIKKGVDVLANAVKVTLGPKGRNVLIERSHNAQITKDGVTIAREIVLEDRLENMGAQTIKEAATKTVDRAGDGTTTAVVLAQAIVADGFKNIVAGANPMEIRTGLEKGLAVVVERLKKMSKPVSTKAEIKEVAVVSANGDEEIGEKLATVMEKIGKDGTVTVEVGSDPGITEKYVPGMQFDKGLIMPHFINNEKLTAEVDSPFILITDAKILSNNQFVPLFDKAMKEGIRNFVVIAQDIEGEALATLIVNKMKGTFGIAAVKAPGYGDRQKAILEDIAILTGGTFLTEDTGKKLEEAEVVDFGRAQKVIVSKDDTVIIDGQGNSELVKARIGLIEKQIEDSDSVYDKERLKERLAKLTTGVGIIKVGAATEVEMKERRDRLDDAVQATKAAMQEGVVAGGGIALIDAAKALFDLTEITGDEKIGVEILRRVLQSPARQIIENAGVEVGTIIAQLGNGMGYDARANKVVDMVKNGIVDPVKVTRMALENAVSTCALLLTTEAVVAEKVEGKKDDNIEIPV